MATNFFQRWSSRKLTVREELVDSNAADNEEADIQVQSQPADLNEQSSDDVIEVASCDLDSESGLDAVAEPECSDEAPTLTLKDVANVTFDSGVTSFMKTGVEKSVKKAALRKLFHSDEFNYVSDMDDHTEDFSNVPTLDSSVTKQLRNWVNQASEELEEAAEKLNQLASDGEAEDLAERDSLTTEAGQRDEAEISEQRASIYTSVQGDESETAFDASNAKLDALSERS